MSKVKKVFTVINIVSLVVCLGAVFFVTSVIKANRFSLEAKNPIDRTIGVLIALDDGVKDKAKAEKVLKVFKDIKKELLSEGFRGDESVHSKAMLVYFLLRIKSHGGLEVEDKVIDKIEPMTLTVTDISRVWYYLAHKEREKLGEDVYGKWENPPYPPGELRCKCCGYTQATWEYIAWKFGQGEKPVRGDWAIVP